MTTKEELAMSDEEFRENYLDENRKWIEHYGAYHATAYGGVHCANWGCNEELTAETMRPDGGKNYCPRHFKEKAMAELKHFFSLEHPPTPQQIETFEWQMRVVRVMDGGLVKLAETSDPELD